MITAKFTCHTIRPSEEYEIVGLSPVYGPANEPWSSATPAGLLELYISNPSARGKFERGKDYMLTIEPV